MTFGMLRGFRRLDRGERFTEAALLDGVEHDCVEAHVLDAARHVERTGSDRAARVAAGEGEAELGVPDLVAERVAGLFDEGGGRADAEGAAFELSADRDATAENWASARLAAGSSPYNASAYSGVEFYAKGNAPAMVVLLAGVADAPFVNARNIPLTGEWRLYQILFDDPALLVQDTSERIAFEASSFIGLEFQRDWDSPNPLSW